jgi:hypothetical protein
MSQSVTPVRLSTLILSMFLFEILLGILINTIISSQQAYSQQCMHSSGSTTLEPLQNTGGLNIIHPNKSETFVSQEKPCSGPRAQLTIINYMNNPGCFQKCLLASNSTMTGLGNNPKLDCSGVINGEISQ